VTKSPSNRNLKRRVQPIPRFVREALRARRLFEEYRARPAYQRNDYILWIIAAKTLPTKQRRLGQMLDELEAGNVYMKGKWKG
jgi:uncharacterized protein YdeI (YjbR/CyaY-like superfamily)